MRRKLRIAAASVLTTAVLFGCAAAKSDKTLTLKALNGKEIKAQYVKTIETKDGKIEVYRLSLKTKTMEKDAYLYKVGDYVFTAAFKLDREGHLIPIRSVTVRPITLSQNYLNGIKDLEKKAEKLGVKYEGRGKPVYVFLDAYCPFCINNMKTHYREMIKKHRVVLLPFAVHGEPSLHALACIYEESAREKKPVGEVFLKHFEKFRGNWTDYAKQYQNCKPDKKYLDLVKETTSWAVQNGIKGTPGIIFPTEKGYKLYYGKLPKKEQQTEK